MGVGVYGENIFGKDIFNLEWKSEGATNDDSGDSEEDEGEVDWLRLKADVVWNRKFVPEIRWCMSERTVCDF